MKFVFVETDFYKLMSLKNRAQSIQSFYLLIMINVQQNLANVEI